MATIPINDTAPRIAYTASAGQTVFPYPFWINAEEDIKVYQNGTLLTLTTNYTVSTILEPTGGNVTLLTSASLNDEIVIVRDIPIKRTSEFQTGGSFQASVLNSSLSKQVAMLQQVEDNQSRSLQLNQSDTFNGDMNLPKITADKYLKVKSDTTGWELVSAPVSATTGVTLSAGDAYKLVNVNATENDFDIISSVGNSGEILTSNGSASAPSWQSPPATQNGAFHAILGANQTITTTTLTKVLFDTILYDKNNNYDNTTNYRFTPTIAGKYFIYTKVLYLNPLVADRYGYLYIHKNGSQVAQSVVTHPTDDASSIMCNTVIDFNGTTDYIEVYTFHNNGVNQDLYGYSTADFCNFGAIKVT